MYRDHYADGGEEFGSLSQYKSSVHEVDGRRHHSILHRRCQAHLLCSRSSPQINYGTVLQVEIQAYSNPYSY